MNANTLSHTAEVLFLLIRACKGDLGRTKLAKLAYLSDYTARCFTGKPITNFEYVLFENGPLDSRFYHVKESLQKQGYVQERYMAEWDAYRYDVVKEPDTFSLTPLHRFIVERVAEQYGHVSLSVLLDDVVYKTPPAKQAREHGILMCPIDFSGIDGASRDPLGLDLTTYVEAIEDREAQRMIPIDEVIGAL